ncbi:MAG TPA: zinc-binding alcohol dehydrogenase family protein [Gammaproteobacteria bacterium]|nr:zinc-binding alcohol dehydrogenase family protein [Gammaproteobacteria bacterium]
MKALYVAQHVKDAKSIVVDLVEKPKPEIKKDQCLIKIISSGINPSDALAVTGYFSHAVAPRIPGRDFAGTVVEGPKDLIGKHVWGTGGAAGISSDGTQAEFIVLSSQEISEIPSILDPLVAGAQPLPYVTAYYSLVKRAHIQEHETVVVVGALGQVGSAAMSICHWKKCKAIALVRGNKSVETAKKLGWQAIDTDDKNMAEKMLAANNNKPVNVILNTVGNIYWADYIKALAEFGRIVTIGARENFREVNINLFNLYRANQDLIGINTISFDFSENARMLDELRMGFEANKLKPLTVDPEMIYSPEKATDAYKAVLEGSAGKRVVIKF